MRSLSGGAIECGLCQESLSARLDGERAPIPAAQADAHLSGCADCSDWWWRAQDQAATLRLGSHTLAPMFHVELPRERPWWARLVGLLRKPEAAEVRLPEGSRAGRRTGHLRVIEEPPA